MSPPPHRPPPVRSLDHPRSLSNLEAGEGSIRPPRGWRDRVDVVGSTSTPGHVGTWESPDPSVEAGLGRPRLHGWGRQTEEGLGQRVSLKLRFNSDSDPPTLDRPTHTRGLPWLYGPRRRESGERLLVPSPRLRSPTPTESNMDVRRESCLSDPWHLLPSPVRGPIFPCPGTTSGWKFGPFWTSEPRSEDQGTPGLTLWHHGKDPGGNLRVPG